MGKVSHNEAGANTGLCRACHAARRVVQGRSMAGAALADEREMRI